MAFITKEQLLCGELLCGGWAGYILIGSEQDQKI
jgi:hypothetical protein